MRENILKSIIKEALWEFFEDFFDGVDNSHIRILQKLRVCCDDEGEEDAYMKEKDKLKNAIKEGLMEFFEDFFFLMEEKTRLLGGRIDRRLMPLWQFLLYKKCDTTLKKFEENVAKFNLTEKEIYTYTVKLYDTLHNFSLKLESGSWISQCSEKDRIKEIHGRTNEIVKKLDEILNLLHEQQKD